MGKPKRPIREQEVLFEPTLAQNSKCLLKVLNIVISRISSIASDQKIHLPIRQFVEVEVVGAGLKKRSWFFDIHSLAAIKHHIIFLWDQLRIYKSKKRLR